MFIVKLDSDGNFIWIKSIGGTEADIMRDLVLDHNGDIIVTGSFRGTVEFNTTPQVSFTSQGNRDIFIEKLDSDGNFIWAHSLLGSGDNVAYSLTIDETGNIYTTGQFQNTVDFDPSGAVFSITSAGNSDGFIQKLDTDGNFVWATSFGGTGNDFGNDITYDDFGNIYATGNFENTASFAPLNPAFDLTSIGSTDAFVLKIDTAGNVQYVNSIGGTTENKGTSIASDQSGNVIVCGDFTGTIDLDPGIAILESTTTTPTAHFIQKLDSNGNLIWVTSMNGGTTFAASTINVTFTPNNQILVTGNFANTTDFDPGPDTMYLNSNGGNDVFIQLLDANGDLVWAESFGGTENEYTYGMVVNTNIYMTGGFKNIVDFDPSADPLILESAGDHDVFILNLSLNEICNNAIDDDSNGLTDLNDNTCFDDCNTWVGTPITTVSLGGLCDDNLVLINADSNALSCSPQWYLNDVALIGETNNLLGISDREYGIGSYTIRTDCDPCSAHTVEIIDIDAKCTHSITGIVKSDATPLTTGNLYVIDASTEEIIQTILINNGDFFATCLCLDDYKLLASALGSDADNFDPTYYYGENNFDDAHTIELTEPMSPISGIEISLIATGLENQNLSSTVKLYPNPTQGDLNIDLSTPQQHVNIQLFDVTGRLINSYTNLSGKHFSLEMAETPGLYYLKIRTETGSISQKVILSGN